MRWPFLTRKVHDLEMDVPVTVHEAMAGAVVTVPTPTGDVKLTVPPGVMSGARMRIRGRGIQKREPGDLYIIIRPAVPASTDPDILAAAEKISSAYPSDVRSTLKL